MQKKKKISVKFFPKPIKKEKGKYAAYCRVIYDKNSTIFSLHMSFSADSVKQAQAFFDREGESWPPPVPLQIRKIWIEKVIEEEAKFFGDKHTIKGFNERMMFYYSRLGGSYTRAIHLAILDNLKSILTYKDYIEYEEMVSNGRDCYRYFKIFDQLKILSESYKVNIKDVINETIFKFILATGYFISMELNRSIEIDEKSRDKYKNKVLKMNGGDEARLIPKLLDRVPLKLWEDAGTEITQWMIDEREIKKRYREFIDSKQADKRLQDFSENGIGELAKTLGFKLNVSAYEAVEIMDSYVRDYQKINFK